MSSKPKINKVSDGKIRLSTNNTISALKKNTSTTKGSYSNFKGLTNKSRKRLSIVVNKSPKVMHEKKIRIVSRDKVQFKMNQMKPFDKRGSKEIIRPKMIKIDKKKYNNAKLYSKLDKLINAKSRSIEITKKAHLHTDKRKHNIVSEDKKNMKYIVSSKPIYKNMIRENPRNTESREQSQNGGDGIRKRNKYYKYLMDKLNKRGDYQRLKNMVKRNFADWKDAERAEFHSFSNLSEFYKIKKKIGKGCFGKVYMATQVLTNTSVALKMIPKTSIKNKNTREKIEKEVEILKRVNDSKHVIKLFEVFEDKEYVYLVFEYLENGDLIRYFKKNPLFEEEDLKDFFKQVVEGVQYIHNKKIIHRDIKLDNILLDKKNNPKLCDFGISSLIEPGKKIFDTGGTPAYLAPEVIKAEGEVGPKTDVWSLGVLLYLMTFGTVPFKADDLQVLYNKVIIGKYKLPSADFASDELLDIIRKMLIVDINKRISLEDVLQDVWFADAEESSEIKEKGEKTKEKTKKEGIMAFLKELGFPPTFITQTVNKGLFNHAKACIDSLMVKLNCN